MPANRIEIDPSQCKGCRVCVEACPRGCIAIASEINELGYQPAKFLAEKRCAACGLCFYVCPEPGAITVYKVMEP
jgi:NAD-dependent dihydropyrimidine dehydrogenase PreA subunit